MLSAKETANLFRASCVALIATAMCFGVRADVMDAQAGMFQFSREQIGWIAGAAFWGFTIAMFVGGQICDLLGMRLMIALGFVGHVLGILMSACAGRFWTLYAGTLAIGMANGVIEAALNPLAATLYPERKTERLNALHVWFPGGIVLGGLMKLGADPPGVRLALQDGFPDRASVDLWNDVPATQSAAHGACPKPGARARYVP